MKAAVYHGRGDIRVEEVADPVPGPGDNQSGACLPKALTLELVATGGGYVDAPIQPPTSVCEQGTLNFDLLKSG